MRGDSTQRSPKERADHPFRRHFVHVWRRDVNWLCDIARPILVPLTLLLLFDCVSSAAAIGCTLLNRSLIDNAVSGDFSAMQLVPIVGLTLASMLIGALSGAVSLYANERFAFSLRSRVFSHILRGRWKNVSAMHTGDINSRATADTEAVAGGMTSAIPSCVHLCVRLLLSFSVLYSFDRVLALSILLVTPAGLFAAFKLGRRLKTCQARLKENDAAARSYMQDCLSNIPLCKTFQIEDNAAAHLNSIYTRRLPLLHRRCLWGVVSRLVMGTVFSGGYLFALGWGVRRLALGEITFGTLSMFFSLVSQIQGPLSSLSALIPVIANMLASTDRLIEADEIPQEIIQPTEPFRDSVGVAFSHVRFAYDDCPVLQDASLDILPGEILGVVGDSGIGKTTLARLVMALWEPQKGTVAFYDQSGHHERACAASRRLISYVPQGNTLLSGTIRDNLKVGDADADDAAMRHALMISLADFVFEMPLQLNTPISEGASTLSEGQAQRIAIARALLRKAPVLILDEVTSALDLDTERALIESLRNHLSSVTCIVITHRRSLLSLCQRCVKISDGRIDLWKCDSDA